MTPTPVVPTPTLTATIAPTTTQTPTPSPTQTPTLINGMSVMATTYQNGTRIQWEAGYQPTNLGFRVYREVNGVKALVSPDLIAGSALLSGPTISLAAGRGYSWWDKFASPGINYWVEELDIHGNRTLYGPVVSVQGTGSAPGQISSQLLSSLNLSHVSAPQFVVQPTPMGFAAAVAKATPKPTASPTPLPAQTAIKLGISQPGWYRVPLKTLTANGLKAGNGNKLHLYAEGVEQPLEIKTAGVEFYGTGLDTPSTNTRVYWLVNGAVSKTHVGTSNLRSKVNAGADFLAAVELRDRSIYFPAANSPTGIDFFGQVVSTTALDETVTATNLSRPDNAMLEVGLQGVTAGTHTVTVELNNIMLDTVTFADQQNQSFLLPASSIANGANVVTLTAENPGDVSLVDHLTLTYEQTYAAVSDQLQLIAPPSQVVTVSGFSSSKVRMIDISNPSAPIELTVTAKRPKGSTTWNATATAPAGTFAGATDRTIIAFRSDLTGTPDSMTLHTPATLTPFPSQVDTIMISPSTLTGALQPLISLRQSQGLHVTTVDIAQIYDAFNFGEKDPVAIKNFLQSANNSTPAPRYVLLVGDASYDPRNFLGLAAVRPDLVPTEFTNSDGVQALSDGWFTDFANNLEPQMAIGRLPAITAADVTALVNKIVAYDSVTPGNVFLLASDLSDPSVPTGFTFADDSNSLLGLLPAGASATSITRAADNSNHQALIDAINSSPDVVNYIGHGNENTWGGLSTGQNWLTNADVPALTNNAHPAVFFLMTCLNGFFADPMQESIAEALLRANGGAVAVWASSGLTVPSGQVAAAQMLYQSLFSSQNAPALGPATRQAQNFSTDPDVKQTWNLLGDPETQLR